MAEKTKIAIAGNLNNLSEIIEQIREIYNNKPCFISPFCDDEADVSLIELWAKYDAVIMLGSNDAEADERLKERLVGHAHLRYVDCFEENECLLNAVRTEIDAILSGLEIEKKFLIAYPDFDALAKYKPFKVEISQTYLISSLGSHRIRKRGANGIYTYFETLKIRVSPTCCEESESVISEKEYNELMKAADPDKSTINKFRYCFLFEGQYCELDVFDFWNDMALLEIELKNEDDTVILPDEITVIEDVSDNPKYKNNHLASLKL